MLLDGVNGADVGMIQCRSGSGLALEALHSSRILGKFGRKKLKSNASTEPDILGFVNHAHSAAAEFAENAIV